MAQFIDKNKNIDEINYNITLKNVNGFVEFQSDPFYVCGNPWVIKLQKHLSQNPTLQSGVKSDFLCVYLCPRKGEDRPDNWAIVASFTTKIISSKPNVIAPEMEPRTYVYDSERHFYGISIPWKELVNPERGYVHNDTCKIIVTVKSSPLQTAQNDELVTLIPIKKCCDASAKFSFLLEVNCLHGFVNVCSPEFTLNNIPWRLLVCKMKNRDGQGGEDILQIRLQRSSVDRRPTAKRVLVALACKVVTPKLGVDPVFAKMENKDFKYGNFVHALDIISWKELLNPENKYSENDSFILEFRMEIREIDEQWTNEAANDDNDAGKFVCPICLENLMGKSISVPIKCGHIYHSDCIHRSLRNRPRCPKCNKFAAINQLRRVYLSME